MRIGGVPKHGGKKGKDGSSGEQLALGVPGSYRSGDRAKVSYHVGVWVCGCMGVSCAYVVRVYACVREVGPSLNPQPWI